MNNTTDLGSRRELSDDDCELIRAALKLISSAVLFEFAREPRGIREGILGNLVARAQRVLDGVFALWALRDYQDCLVLFRCLLERYFLLVDLWENDSFELFEEWSFLEQFKAVQRVLGDESVDTGREDLFVPPTPEQKRRATQLFRHPPQWRRPKAEDVAKRQGLWFLYTYGYDQASAHVHPMASDGMEDFYLLTGLIPAPAFPDQSSVLRNTLLLDTMIVQDAMNASRMRWMQVVWDALDDVRKFMADDEKDLTAQVATLNAAFRQDLVLSQTDPDSGPSAAPR